MNQLLQLLLAYFSPMELIKSMPEMELNSMEDKK